MATKEEIGIIVATIDLTKRWENLQKVVDGIDKLLVDLGKEGAILNLQGIPTACEYLGNARKLIYSTYESEEVIVGDAYIQPVTESEVVK